jgi:hypothetical protein
LKSAAELREGLVRVVSHAYPPGATAALHSRLPDVAELLGWRCHRCGSVRSIMLQASDQSERWLVMIGEDCVVHNLAQQRAHTSADRGHLYGALGHTCGQETELYSVVLSVITGHI